ncbi:MAG: DNA-processing protein DprA [Lachnospiraceae bacterium]|nr:DNA-processing protein DprA [Lachnospiraceae bacterium]
MTGDQTEKAYMHWLYQAAGMNSRVFLRGLEQIGTARTIYETAKKGALEVKIHARYQDRARKLQEAAGRWDIHDIAEEYEKMLSRGISFVTFEEAAYPRKLSKIQDAPYALYYAGRLPDEEGRSIAVIGARNCTEYGKCMAKEFGTVLARAGVQVISGMARGIDGIGQRSALCAGGYSLGVLGCGVDICYPQENRELYEQLLVKGGLCSEYPPGIEPRAALFPPRNRIISGLCDGVLVIEAKERSGTLITVDMALEQGREVYAVPGRATDALSAGCNRLIRQGAQLVMNPEELLEELWAGFIGIRDQNAAGRLTRIYPAGLQGEILKLLDYQPQSIEKLQEAYRKAYGNSVAVPKLCYELLQLCAEGYVGQGAGKYYLK